MAADSWDTPKRDGLAELVRQLKREGRIIQVPAYHPAVLSDEQSRDEPENRRV